MLLRPGAGGPTARQETVCCTRSSATWSLRCWSAPTAFASPSCGPACRAAVQLEKPLHLTALDYLLARFPGHNEETRLAVESISCPPDHTCGHPLPRVYPKGKLNGAYRLTVYVCHAFCSKKCRRPARTCFAELEARQGGSDMIECLPGAHWPGSAWGCSVLELPASKSTTYFSSYRGHFSASPATKERSLKLASTATDS